MKNSFIKKVAVLSAGAVVLSSMSFLGVNAQTQDTVLTGEACVNPGTSDTTANVQKVHGVNFGSFTTADVANSTASRSGNKDYDDGEVANTILPTAGTGIFITVNDPCAEAGWDLDVQVTDMTNAAGNKIFADSIEVTGDEVVYLIEDTGSQFPSTIDEITAFNPAEGGNGPTIFDPEYTNTDWSGTVTVLSRTLGDPADQRGGEFGVNLSFDLIIPQYQPGGTYEGDLIITL